MGYLVIALQREYDSILAAYAQLVVNECATLRHGCMLRNILKKTWTRRGSLDDISVDLMVYATIDKLKLRKQRDNE